MKRLLTLAVATCCLQPAIASADSDGYFCSGRGYLAYEMSFSQNVEHSLFVVHFGPETGMTEPRAVRLETFQTHGMRCGPTTVEVRGWERSYFFDVSVRGAPPRVIDRPDPAVMAGAILVDDNLGDWSTEGVVELQSGDADARFQLVIAKVDHLVQGGVEHHTATALIERYGVMGVRRILTIFNGVFLETIDARPRPGVARRQNSPTTETGRSRKRPY